MVATYSIIISSLCPWLISFGVFEPSKYFFLLYIFLKLYFHGKAYCYKYSSVYMSVSNSQSIPPSYPSPLVMVPNVYLSSSSSLCCCSAAHSCLTLCDPMDCSTPGLPAILQCHNFLSFYTFMRFSQKVY